MEYEFHHDTITGSASARFSFEHQVIGPWLEIEVGQDSDKLTALLEAMEEVSSGRSQEKSIHGHEYSVIFSDDDVFIKANGLMNGASQLPDELSGDALDIDQQASSSCGVDDFRTLLLSWAKFINKK